MVAFISALLGFVSSAVPDVLKLFRDSQDRAHELEVLKLQMDFDREKLSVSTADNALARADQLKAIGIQADTTEQAALNTRVKDSLTVITWVDALSGSVRPVITYAFFVLYVIIKCAQFSILLSPSLPWQNNLSVSQALVSLWTEEDIAIFSAIMAFWFGQRALMKARK